MLKWILPIAAIGIGYAVYYLQYSDLNVTPEAGREIEKAKRR